MGLGYFLVEMCNAKPQSLILTICGLLLIMIAVDWFFLILPRRQRVSVEKRAQELQQQARPSGAAEEQEAVNAS